MKRVVYCVLTITVGLLSDARAQARPAPSQVKGPDFSGTWRMDTTQSESAGYAEFKGPVILVIKQTATELRIDMKRGDRNESVTYVPDESKKTATSTPGAPTSTWSWDGPRLVTQTVRTVNGETVTATETRSLNPEGTEMTVETVVRVEHGYTVQAQGAKNYGRAKDVFKKVLEH